MGLGEVSPGPEKRGLSSVAAEGVLGLRSGRQEMGGTGMLKGNLSQGNRMLECYSGQFDGLKCP